MKKISLTIITIAICFTLNSEILTLKNAKEITLENNPEYLSKKYAFESAKWEEINSLSGLLPSASLTGSQIQMNPGMPTMLNPIPDDEKNTRSYGYSINQPLFLGGKLWFGYRISRDAKLMSEYALEEQKLKTISAVEEKYFNLLEADKILEISKEQLHSAGLNLEIAEIRYKMGTLSNVDLLKIQSDKAAKETELIQSETLYAMSYSGLKNYLQYSNDFEIENFDTTIYNELITNLNTFDKKQIDDIMNECFLISLNENYSIKTLKETKNMAKKSVSMAAGNFLPTLNLSYSQTWNKSWNQDQNESDSNYDDSKQLALTASIPIFPIADNFADYKKAKYEKRKTDEDYKSAESGIKLDLESSVLNLISSAKQVKASELTLNFTTKLHSQMEERFKNGMVSTSEMLDSEVMLKGAKMSNIQSSFSFIKAKSKLMLLLGMEEEKELIKLLSH